MIRTFDVFISAIALIALAPLFFSVILILRLTGEGKVFFLQGRVGQNRKKFKLYKFVTMLEDSPNIGTGTVTVKGDPRVLPVGKVLRRTKINELPQLLNIFFGDMSLIGPRPQTPRCFDAFPIDMQDSIIKVKPGLSGIGPIVFRNEENILDSHTGTLDFYDHVIAPYKGRVEAWYADKENLTMYFLLVIVTIWVVFFPRSNIVWKIFKDLPIPPDELKLCLNFLSKKVD
ncbi:MAG: lipid carrier--UDP-N-acetylgalactosaminyltransferase [Legionellales bacterium]|nr:lipid carrier--UDP-N-acetylgalactosaminyltransferase [Legionellales bacterium]